MPKTRKRAGRPRKAMAKRDRSGKLSSKAPREREEAATAVAVIQPHRRHASNPLDPRCAYVLGQACMAGLITDEQHQAGCLWAGISRTYLAMTLGQSGTARSPGFASVSERIGDEAGDAPSREWMDPEQRLINVVASYNGARAALRDAGVMAEGEVNAVAVRDEPIERLAHLRHGLNALAGYYRLTRRDAA